MHSGLQQALERRYGLERRGDALGLDGTRALLAALGHPETRFRAVHVAGTNGKGSVCAMVERVLRAAGVRTGLYTSPHLVDFRERIRVDGRWADDTRLARALDVIDAAPAADARTFFEVATALGFDAFAHGRAAWGVVEVGLGGRLDCTNVLEPDVCAITGIGLDHTEILGTTLADVAREKVGIAKPGVPLVSGAAPPEAQAVIEDGAKAAGAPLVDAAARVVLHAAAFDADGARLEVEAAPWGRLALALGMRGRHQTTNARVALAVLSLLAERGLAIPATAVVEGLARVRWPGRLEPCPAEPRLWWDAAHNAEGMGVLARAWQDDLRLAPPDAVVVAVARDKEAGAMLAILRHLAPAARLFVTETRSHRALPAAALLERARTAGWEGVVETGVAAATRAALDGTTGRVLLAGSLFAVGEAMEALGGAPGANA